MAHSKHPNGGQRTASVRKTRNRFEGFKSRVAQAAELGISVLALEIRQYKEVARLIAKPPRHMIGPPQGDLYGSMYRYR